MKNVNESGRSMVEMLGVLAIIGVLSIGGIAGYTMAMNRYRANEAMAAANMAIVESMARNNGQVNYEDMFGVTLPSPIATVTAAGNTATITFDAGEGDAVMTIVDQVGGARTDCTQANTCTVTTEAAADDEGGE